MQLPYNCLIATGDKKLEIFDLRKGCTLLSIHFQFPSNLRDIFTQTHKCLNCVVHTNLLQFLPPNYLEVFYTLGWGI